MVNTAWAIKHLSIELALLSWSPTLLHPAFHCIKKNLPWLYSLEIFKCNFLDWEHSKQAGCQQGFPCQFLFIPSGWQRKKPMGWGSILAMLVLYQWFIFTVVLWDYWFLGLIIPCSCIVLLWRFKHMRQNVIYCFEQRYVFSLFEIICHNVKMKVCWRNLTDSNLLLRLCIHVSHKYTCTHMHTPTHVLPAETNFAEFKWTSKISASSSDTSVSELWWLTDAASIFIIPPCHYP